MEKKNQSILLLGGTLPSVMVCILLFAQLDEILHCCWTFLQQIQKKPIPNMFLYLLGPLLYPPGLLITSRFARAKKRRVHDWLV